MKKRISIKILILFLLTFLVASLIITRCAYAVDTSSAISAMGGMAGADLQDDTGKLGGIINSAIGLIQVAGTGISMIMVTLLGIRYIMASPSDKADVKKQIAPLVIGAIILFASVNLVGIIADFADTTLQTAAS